MQTKFVEANGLRFEVLEEGSGINQRSRPTCRHGCVRGCPRRDYLAQAHSDRRTCRRRRRSFVRTGNQFASKVRFAPTPRWRETDSIQAWTTTISTIMSEAPIFKFKLGMDAQESDAQKSDDDARWRRNPIDGVRPRKSSSHQTPGSPARASGFGQSGSEVIDSTFVLVG
jgi:hypothetical protein